MKKQFNVRLSAEALLALKVTARERQCTEAELIESWALAGSSNGRTEEFGSSDAGSIPAPAANLEDKKARAMAALAGIGKKTLAPDMLEPNRDDFDLMNIPKAPFDVNLDGEPHRVTTMGKRLGLYYLGGGEPLFNRHLVPGELETFWEKRIQ